MYSEKKDRHPVSDKAIVPMTIHQINTILKDDSMIENQHFHTISIIGRMTGYTKFPRFNTM